MAEAQHPAGTQQRMGWSGGLALGLAALCYLLTILPVWALFRLSLEISGWTEEAMWLGPGWLGGLVLGCAALVVGVRTGKPRNGAFIFLGLFLLWLMPLGVAIAAQA